jgi:elongation factor Ts
MTISATLVKELRERTGSGMMECKRALEATAGDIEAAVEKMRKEGMAKADKKAGRVAAEGAVLIRISEDGQAGLILEINCETDFVAKDASFQAFCQDVAAAALKARPADLEALLALDLGGESIDQRRRSLVAKIGENIGVRRFAFVPAAGGVLASYIHGGRIGVLVALKGGDAELARDLAMHIAASNPAYVSASDVPEEAKAKEREIIAAQTADAKKPADIIAKMVEGKLRKFLNEITLLGQPFVKNPDQTVEQLLKQAGATVTAFQRYAVGEGIEKQTGDFAAEVAAAAQAAK